MSGGSRTLQIGEQIRRELGQLLIEGLKDPRIGFVTFSSVKVSRDMSVAMVNYKVLGSDKQIKDSHNCLQQSGGWLRRELSRRRRLSYVTELRFVLDHNLENSMQINEMLANLPDEDRKPL